MTSEAWVSLVIGAVGAAAGVFAAVYVARWSFDKVAQEQRQERLGDEVAALRAARMEIGVAQEIAAKASATPLPTALLVATMPSIHHMTQAQRDSVVTYTQHALRYNARVARLIAYGQAKRMVGERPGAEKPEEHAKAIEAPARAAAAAIDEHLRSDRFHKASYRAPGLTP